MHASLGEGFRHRLASLDPQNPRYATDVVDSLLGDARKAHVSDIHVQPTAEGLEVRWRVDGVLHAIAGLPVSLAPNVIARMKVMADLLTYRTDIPQEGRIRGAPGDIDMRVSTFPTLHGEKAVVRLFAGSGGRFERLDDLGLPDEIASALRRLLGETSGAVLFTGPAGSGKTTTIYACLRELVAETGGSRSLATLEDPIEVPLEGVAQAQVNPSVGLDLAAGLRSLLRQDPEVIAVGEIRDQATAEVAMQASLTGHLVLTTFHAGSAAGALGRLGDMGIEPYLLRSGILAVVFQRLARKLCPSCSAETIEPADMLGLPLSRARLPVGCDACAGTGYLGRIVIAEILFPDRGELATAVLARTDVDRLEQSAITDGMISRWSRAVEAVSAGMTSPAEVRRVLGFSDRAERN